MNDEDVPKSLVALYSEARVSGRYDRDIESFVAIRYLLFRTAWREGQTGVLREPPSRKVWLQHMLDYERLCDEGK
jgi:hypothetical protein